MSSLLEQPQTAFAVHTNPGSIGAIAEVLYPNKAGWGDIYFNFSASVENFAGGILSRGDLLRAMLKDGSLPLDPRILAADLVNTDNPDGIYPWLNAFAYENHTRPRQKQILKQTMQIRRELADLEGGINSVALINHSHFDATLGLSLANTELVPALHPFTYELICADAELKPGEALDEILSVLVKNEKGKVTGQIKKPVIFLPDGRATMINGAQVRTFDSGHTIDSRGFDVVLPDGKRIMFLVDVGDLMSAATMEAFVGARPDLIFLEGTRLLDDERDVSINPFGEVKEHITNARAGNVLVNVGDGQINRITEIINIAKDDNRQIFITWEDAYYMAKLGYSISEYGVVLTDRYSRTHVSADYPEAVRELLFDGESPKNNVITMDDLEEHLAEGERSVFITNNKSWPQINLRKVSERKFTASVASKKNTAKAIGIEFGFEHGGRSSFLKALKNSDWEKGSIFDVKASEHSVWQLKEIYKSMKARIAVLMHMSGKKTAEGQQFLRELNSYTWVMPEVQQQRLYRFASKAEERLNDERALLLEL
jgi:hypothetical protein